MPDTPDPPPVRQVTHRRMKATTGQINRFQLPKVFTIFCHGTGGHRDGRCMELISEFSNAYWKADYDPYQNPDEKFYWNNDDPFFNEHYTRDFLILDGVGTCDMFTTPPIRSGEPYYDRKPDEVGLAGAEPIPNINPMPGDFVPNDPDSLWPPFQKPLKTPVKLRTSDHITMNVPMKKHRGDIDGDGWDDNVAHALFVLQQLYDDNQFPAVINMIGWSRGAVTCIKLANAISSAFATGGGYQLRENDSNPTSGNRQNPAVDTVIVPQGIREEVSVNIFAIDPVPGRFGKDGGWRGSSRKNERFPEMDWECHNLPPIVSDCIVTLALDERRMGFAPVDLRQMAYRGGSPEHQNVVFLPYPGIHRSQVRMEPRDPDKPASVRQQLTSVPHLVFDLAWQFLTDRGTRFRTNYLDIPSRPFQGLMTLERVVEQYSLTMNQRHHYHLARNQGIAQRGQGGLGDRKFTDRGGSHKLKNLFPESLTPYVRDRRRMCNEHHRASFEAAYPALYQYLFTEECEAPADYVVDPASPVGWELAAIGRESATRGWLRAIGVSGNDEVDLVPAPGAGMSSQGTLHELPGDVVEMGIVRLPAHLGEEAPEGEYEEFEGDAMYAEPYPAGHVGEPDGEFGG